MNAGFASAAGIEKPPEGACCGRINTHTDYNIERFRYSGIFSGSPAFRG